ncbi:glycosyltransferase family 25 protein [Photobacterium damselae]
MTKIYIISLLDSNRRIIIKDRLNKLGIDGFMFIDAFDAREMDENILRKHFDYERFFLKYNRYPANGEVGCTLSHIKAYQMAKKSSVNKYIVLEDDAILDDSFVDLLNNNDIKTNGCLLLGKSKYSKRRMLYRFLVDRFFIKKVSIKERIKINKNYLIYNNEFKDSCGTVGYMVNGADSFYNIKLFETELPYFLADDWELLNKYIGIYYFYPFLVFEDYNNQKSSIHDDRELLSTDNIFIKVKKRIGKILFG